MSCEEYEQGSVVLSAEAAQTVHAALIEIANTIRQAARDAIRQLPGYYASDMDWRARRDAEQRWRRDIEKAQGDVLCWLTLDDIQQALEHDEDPVAIVDRLLPTATDETKRFEAGFTTITVNDRGVSWWAEGNRVHETLNDHPVYRTLHEHLDAVAWTDGTGGTSWRADEHDLGYGWTRHATWGDVTAASSR